MSKKEKVIFFVTLVIRHTVTKMVKGSSLPMKQQHITIYQKSQKQSTNASEAYSKTLIEAQMKHESIQMMAYTVTELSSSMFDITEEDIENDKKVDAEIKRLEGL